jgi:hypothetical protein
MINMCDGGENLETLGVDLAEEATPEPYASCTAAAVAGHPGRPLRAWVLLPAEWRLARRSLVAWTSRLVSIS